MLCFVKDSTVFDILARELWEYFLGLAFGEDVTGRTGEAGHGIVEFEDKGCKYGEEREEFMVKGWRCHMPFSKGYRNGDPVRE